MMAQLCVVPAVSGGFARPRRWRVVLPLGLALSLGCVGRSQAATTWTVCASGCDYASIKAAIAAPTTLDGDTLAIAAGSYTEAGILVHKSLALQGAGAASTIVQAAATKGTASDRVFSIPSGVTVPLRALTIRYGRRFADGGGLYNAGTLTLSHSTVSGNSAAYYSGGLVNIFTVTLINSTVSGNSACDAGGLYNATGMVTLSNSMVADRLQGGDCGVRSGSPSITSQGYNLDSDGTGQLTAPTDRPGVNPRLGPLQNNGGPTLTHALLPGSPAIDVIPWGTNGCGTTTYSDQRWRARPHPAGGACGIGAYEVGVPGQAYGGWVSGFTPDTVVCQNVTTGEAVTLNAPTTPWDCEAAGVGITPGDQVALRVRGPLQAGAMDVGGAVIRMAPSGGSCTNLTTGHQVPFRGLFQGIRGATAASCVAAGLVVRPGDRVEMRVQGAAE